MSTIFFLCLLLSIYTITNISPTFSQCLEDQKLLLLGLNNTLIFDSSYSQKLVRWNGSTDCCRWAGVECDAAGHVTSLQLDQEKISGGIENSEYLFKLRYLEKLNLAHNYLNNVPIPKGFYNLTNLTHLNLSSASFGGQVPIEISRMTRLVSLDLSAYYYPDVPLKLENPNLKMLVQNLTGLRELYLDGVDISGQGSDWCQVLSSSLPHLTILSLQYCDLSGPIDSSLTGIQSLSVLHLDGNNLSSSVPTFFTSFSKLTTLSLARCSLLGSFPENIFQIPTLQNLDISGNRLLSGNLPQFPRNGSLRTIVLSYTNFSGSLPHSISNLGMLSSLKLSNCRFDGPVPSTMANLTELVYLDISANNFTGTVQLEMFKSPNLSMLDLSYNSLFIDSNHSNSSLPLFPRITILKLASCKLQKFPQLSRQSTLQVLDLSSNQLKGKIPNWIWEIGNGSLHSLNLSFNALNDFQKPYEFSSFLFSLDLNHNEFQGELPIPHFSLFLDFSFNYFNNTISNDIGNHIFFAQFFSVSNNNFTGEIPASICNAKVLQVLDLSGNALTGTIPSCLPKENLPLEVLSLARNKLSGDIPDTFSANCSLQILDLKENVLEGNIPASLLNCRSLEVLNIANNRIEDTFPCMFMNTSLLVLILRSNKFYGDLQCLATTQGGSILQIIDISNNNFSGDISQLSFTNWIGMISTIDKKWRYNRPYFDFMMFGINYYREYLPKNEMLLDFLLGDLPGILMINTAIDFSRNKFHGSIPSTIGDLKSLYLLNLSHNALTGAIPASIGNLTQLGPLDLSMNHLTGNIPMELATLTFLSFLNLSFNNLSGMIPKGPQFQTFSNDSYEGNAGLCGFPLTISCNDGEGSGVSPPKSQNGQVCHEKEIDWDYISAAMGFAVGLASTVWLFLHCRRWRDVFSDKVDQILKKVYPHKNGGRLITNQAR